LVGPEHPDVAQSLNGLAVLYYQQGRYADAEPLYRRALAQLSHGKVGLAVRDKALVPTILMSPNR
jgi:tetratricopeptide (TPR) repeat protein